MFCDARSCCGCIKLSNLFQCFGNASYISVLRCRVQLGCSVTKLRWWSGILKQNLSGVLQCFLIFCDLMV